MSNFGLLWRHEGVKGGQVCLSERGVLVECIADRFAAGESVAELAADYDAKPDAIEAALRLVIVARGVNLDEKRAAAKVAQHIPLLRDLRRRPAPVPRETQHD